MFDLLEEIGQADEMLLSQLLKAVLQRYEELFPDWEISTISLEKCSDTNEQLDRMITILEQMKSNS